METEERFGLSLTRKQATSLQKLMTTTLALSSKEKPVPVSCMGHALFPPAINWDDVKEFERQFIEILEATA
jgi:hypothetical protein